jgi:protein-tyrosine phosphatase
LSPSAGFVDLHVHLLAGLDDGPADVPAALDLCRRLEEQGVVLAAAICHQRGAFAHRHVDEIRAVAGELNRLLEAEGRSLRVVPNAEWMIDARTLERLVELLPTLMTLADARRYALVEFPFEFPSYASLLADILRGQEIRPILAHIEKYPMLAHNPARVRELIDLGFLTQVNADSIVGRSHPDLSVACRRLVQRGLVHLVASDAHSITTRPPRLKQAFDTVTRWTDPATAGLLFRDNPQQVVDGGDVKMPAAVPWWRRWARPSR